MVVAEELGEIRFPGRLEEKYLVHLMWKRWIHLHSAPFSLKDSGCGLEIRFDEIRDKFDRRNIVTNIWHGRGRSGYTVLSSL